MNGAESLVRALVADGVDVCFTNPGTSEMHFVSALDRVPGMRCVLGLFEGVVTGAADGYWRIADRPASTLLHLGPGLANGLANLHNAKKAHSGIVNIVGEHGSAHVALDAPLTSDIEGIARPMSNWVRTSRSASDVARDGRHAVAQARRAPGHIATLILPADTAWGEVDPAAQVGAPPEVAPASAASPDAVVRAARALASAREVPTLLLVGGNALREGALANAGRIAAATGCRLMSEFAAGRVQRGAGRVVAPRVPYVVEAALEALAPFRRIVLAGARVPVAFFAYPGKPGRLVAPDCEIVTLADFDQDPAGALDALVRELGAQAHAPAGVAERVPRDRRGALPTGAVTPEGVGHVLGALLPENAIVVDEAVTSSRGFGPPTATAGPHDWLTSTGGSIGFGLPTATGAAIAAPERKVLALEGDGSAMYTLQSLWTIARESLDVCAVIFANRAYRILHGEFVAVGGGQPGPRATDMLSLDRPALDWVALARGMGVEASQATDLESFATQLARAMSRRGPALIELVL